MTSIGSSARTYDANGNTTGSSTGGDAFGYGYNDRNRMAVVQRNGRTVASYVYSAMGERVAKTAAATQRFAYDEASQLIGEYGATSRSYVWLDNLPVAVVDTNGSTSTVSYVHADALGTPRAVTDGTGAAVWQWGYQANAFGEKAPSAAAMTFNLRFPGQYYDVESGLHYNVQRDYDPAGGRYVQSDPLGVAPGPSTYAYVDGSPINFFDPLGLQEALFRPAPWLEPFTRVVASDSSKLPWAERPQMRISPRTSSGGKMKNDVSDWARGFVPKNGETPNDFARRVCAENGQEPGKGPTSNLSRISKWGADHFKKTPKPSLLDILHKLFDPSPPRNDWAMI